MAEAVVALSSSEAELRSSIRGNLIIRDWSWSQSDADAGRSMGSSACTFISHSWGIRLLTAGCFPPIERHDVATIVAEYDRARRPVGGTIAKAEWPALSIQTHFFKYFDAEGDVMDALTPIETSEGVVGALLNFSERYRTEEIYVTPTLLKQGSASLGGAQALGIFVSSQSVEVRDTHCRSAHCRGMTSMWMPRTSSL